jgi:CRISPR/Cas system-associated endoribonuclease Cas2
MFIGAGMLLQIHEKLDEIIVKSLCHRANMTSKEIHRDVAERSGRSYTAQAIFKELTKLQSAGVVVRLKSRYSLMLSWAMRLTTLAEVAKEAYLTKSPLDLIMAECEVKKTWRCSDFDKVANFWLQAKVALLRHSGGGLLYEWQPHAWTELLYPERHRDLGGALRASKTTAFVVVGGVCPLDRELTKAWGRSSIRVSHNQNLLEKFEHLYLSVVNDHVFTCEITPKHHHQLDKLFEDASLSRIALREHPLFNEKAKFSVKLEKNSKKARQLKNMISEHFV